MYIFKNSTFVFLFTLTLSFFSADLAADTIEEILVTGNWREKPAQQEDSSLVLLNAENIKSQSLKHFEQISFLVPNFPLLDAIFFEVQNQRKKKH